MKLLAHPASPPNAVETVHVSADLRRAVSVIEYRVTGAALMGAPAAPERADDLWKHTCFELFVKPVDGAGYFEFNFAPSTQWAAYSLEGYRKGMADLPLAAPVIERLDDGVRVRIDLSGLPAGEWRAGLSAVVEEPGGTISYWALAHPDGKADFHDPACFALPVRG